MQDAQACKALHELSQADLIWREKALAVYPESTLSLEGYGSYKVSHTGQCFSARGQKARKEREGATAHA